MKREKINIERLKNRMKGSKFKEGEAETVRSVTEGAEDLGGAHEQNPMLSPLSQDQVSAPDSVRSGGKAGKKAEHATDDPGRDGAPEQAGSPQKHAILQNRRLKETAESQ